MNEVVAHEELLPRCRALAADCISIDQRAVRRMHATYREVSDTTVDEGWRIEDEASRAVGGRGLRPGRDRTQTNGDRRTRPLADFRVTEANQ